MSSNEGPDPVEAAQEHPSSNPRSNDNDPNFIPIALPIGDVDPYGDINSIPLRRRHRRFRKHLLPIGPPLTEDQFESLFLDWDDYYANPLVSHPVWAQIDFEIAQIDQILSQFNQLPSQPVNPLQEASFAGAVQDLSSSHEVASAVDTQGFDIPSLLRPDVSKQRNVQFPSDPYHVPGKVIKHGDVLIESVAINQNSNWAAGIDYYEEGRLVSFSITCNDPDMVPTVMVESGSSSQTIINAMSFRQLVQRGRGMTYSAAVSTINTPNGIMSRDIQGTPSTTFPYVARYKDQLTGNGVYDDVKDTVDDKAYTLTYEPTTSIPYQRISFQVYNGSQLGNRMINHLEIHRIIYIDPDPNNSTANVALPEMNKLTAALNTMGTKMGMQLPQALTKTYGANLAREHSKYDELLKFLYQQRFGKKKDKDVDMQYERPVQISSFEDQRKLNELESLIDENDPLAGAEEDTDEEQHERTQNIKLSSSSIGGVSQRNKVRDLGTMADANDPDTEQGEDMDKEFDDVNTNVMLSSYKNKRGHHVRPSTAQHSLDIIWD